MERRWNRSRRRRNGNQLATGDRGFDNRLSEFFEEKGHAIGTFDDLIDDLAGQPSGSASDPANQFRALVPPQSTQSQGRHMGLAGPGWLKLRTEGRDKQHRHSLDLRNGQVEKLT